MKTKKILSISLLFVGLLAFGCKMQQAPKATPKSTIFIGIDVSGSFTRSQRFKDGLEFLGEYIHAHLEGKNGLSKPKDLYVGGIGGNRKEDPQTFFPIHDFQGLSAKQIHSKLKKEFAGQKDRLTDFNTFFQRVKTMVKQKNLVLAPIQIILITDGVPEIQGRSKIAIKQAYSKIDLSPLEYLAKSINVRILYANPRVGNNWRNYVPTRRIKVWSVEPNVMYGWRNQKSRLGPKGLHKWIFDNIDLRIKSRGI